MFAHATLESLERWNERFGNVAAAERTETSTVVGKLTGDCRGEQPGGVG